MSRFLASTLRSGDVLVLDNLAVRKIGGLREWLAKRGVQVLISAVLFARLLADYFQLVYDAEVRAIVVTNSLGYATLLVQFIHIREVLAAPSD